MEGDVARVTGDLLVAVGIALLAASVPDMIYRRKRQSPEELKAPFYDEANWWFQKAPYFFWPGLWLLSAGALVQVALRVVPRLAGVVAVLVVGALAFMAVWWVKYERPRHRRRRRP